MFNTGPLFTDIQNSPAKVVVLQGGSNSGKTWAELQELVYYASFNKDKVITVTGESIPNLKKGAYRDMEALYSMTEYFQQQVTFWNKSDRVITFKSGSVIEFISNLDEQGAKAGKRDRLFVDEAQGVTWPIFFQMAIRTREKIVIAYNPTAPFWAHEKLIGTTPETNDLSATVELIISDHRHNPFLTDDEHAKVEGIKDKELWRVYARGLTGNLTGLIFPNWVKIPDSQYPVNPDNVFWGLDFGYENDETALVKCVKVANNIFIHEVAYQSGDIPPRRIVEILKANGYTEEQPIYCDHDPDNIRQLRMLEILAIAARKGQGSVNAGIQKIKEYNIFYTESSLNIDYERQRYMWMIDPATGKPTNTPKDGVDHTMAAIRYAIYSNFYRSGD